MKPRFYHFFVFLLTIPGILGHLDLNAQSPLNLAVVPFATGLEEPVDIASAGDERLFVVEQPGSIRVLDGAGNLLPVPFLDIRSQVGSSLNEQGMLGLAFHPNYAVNGYAYVYYTNPGSDTRVARFTRDASDPNRLDPSTELTILAVSQPYSNHNGGDLNFGPDGFLYIGLGDGGLFGDPGNRSQSPGTLLGKISRLDVDGGTPYAVPADNPFVGVAGVLDEIWALGVRNPWRAGFDRLTGDYWFADVGQDTREEINRAPAGLTDAVNYGWSCREGTLPYIPSRCSGSAVLTEPVFDYPHNFTTGGLSVTGGFVYRGDANPNLYGNYVFTDFLSGNWWATDADNAAYPTAMLPFNFGGVTTFGERADGELFLARFMNDTIWRLAETCSSGTKISGLHAQVTGPNSAQLYWDAVPGAQGYRVTGQRSGSASPGSKVTASNKLNINILQANSEYRWSVQARCQSGSVLTQVSDTAVFNTPALRQENIAGVQAGEKLSVLDGPEEWTLFADGPGQWQLYDALGRLLAQGASQGSQTSVPKANLASGIYALIWVQESGLRRQAMVRR